MTRQFCDRCISPDGTTFQTIEGKLTCDLCINVALELQEILEKRIENLEKQIKVAEREDIFDINEFGLEHRKQELDTLLAESKRKYKRV